MHCLHRALLCLIAIWVVRSPSLGQEISENFAALQAEAPPQGGCDCSVVSRLESELSRARKTLEDWPNLGRYHNDNAALKPPVKDENRVVFMGDSITDGWGKRDGQFFPGKPFVNRGISGQTTPQMLIRFRPDVIALEPKVVVILAGTNDLAGNTGPTPLEAIENNLSSMAELARANNISVVLASVLPVCDSLQPQSRRRSPEKILSLNGWIRDYTERHNLVYLDYFDQMKDEHGMLKEELTYDCLHPNDAGYKVMGPLAERAISTAMDRHHRRAR